MLISTIGLKLPNLNHAFCLRGDIHRAGLHLSRQLIKRLPRRGLFALERYRMSRIATLADVRIKLNLNQQLQAELARGALAAALGEDINLFAAMRTVEVAHVLDQSKNIHLH